MNELDQFHGPNAAYFIELFDRWQQDPNSVDPASRILLETYTPTDNSHNVEPERKVNKRRNGDMLTEEAVSKVVAAARLTRLVREVGHLAANLDPLGGSPPGDPGCRRSPPSSRRRRR